MKSIMKVGTVVLAMLPAVAAAEPVLPVNIITGPGTVLKWVTSIGNWFFGLLLALAVIFIIYAAFLYLTSGGDEEKVGKAKTTLVYAIIGIAVALLTQGIIFLIGNFLGTGTGTAV